MAHLHSVYDSDAHFKIDPATRVIINQSPDKTALMQYDHNSERFTFELPRYIEEHDMSLCNVVEIHYINANSEGNEENKGIYKVDDLQVSPADENVVICSWLISQGATRIVGSLSFIVRFKCVNNSIVDYLWSTKPCSGYQILKSIDNDESTIDDVVIPSGGGSDLPPVTSADNGKFLRVVDGAWAAVALTDVSQEGA